MSQATTQPISIGIDVSKHSLDVCMIFSDRINDRQSIENTPAGVQELIDWIRC